MSVPNDPPQKQTSFVTPLSKAVRAAQPRALSTLLNRVRGRTRTASIDESVYRFLEPLEHLKIQPKSWKPRDESKFDSGGFGTVQVVKRGEELLAMKQLHFRRGRITASRFAKRFARELTVWAALDHPNLLKLSGFYLKRDLSVAQFFCPFYAHGNVREYLKNFRPDRDTRYRLAEDTAVGLKHLHKLEFVHGDLKDLNVLINDQLRAVLCDYGLAKRFKKGIRSGLTTSGIPMTVKYASPELLSGDRQSFESDIWAWGCLFLKIVTNLYPYKGITGAEMHKVVLVDKAPPANIESLTLAEPLQHMLSQCWDWDPQARPKLTECIDAIRTERLRRPALCFLSPNKSHSSAQPALLGPAETQYSVTIKPHKSKLNLIISASVLHKTICSPTDEGLDRSDFAFQGFSTFDSPIKEPEVGDVEQ